MFIENLSFTDSIMLNINTHIDSDKVKTSIQNARLSTAEWIFEYIHSYIESGQDIQYLSTRKMLEDLFAHFNRD